MTERAAGLPAGQPPEQVRLLSDELEVIVLPQLGARLHRIRAFGRDVLREPDDPGHHALDPFMWGGYPMAPWCNRIEAGPVAVAGRTVALGSNFPDGTAIHGQVYLRSWEVEGTPGPGVATFGVRGGGDGWPWRYAVRQRVAVAGASIRVELALTNADDSPMPGGLGLHPWFVGGPDVAIQGTAVLSPNGDTPAQPVRVGGPTDLRRMGPMPEGLDATWLEIGEPPVMLRWPAIGIGALMRAQAAGLVIVAASPPGAGAIAIEPETHAPQGLRRLLHGEPAPLAMLEPGATLALTMDLDFMLDRAG